MSLITHEGKVFSPDGVVPTVSPDEVDRVNQAMDANELAWIKTGPRNLFLYVKPPKEGASVYEREGNWRVTTWLGSHVGIARVTERYRMGFQGHFRGGSYRRAITAKVQVWKGGIVGGELEWADYHGWYMESSGDYCRLKRSKGK